MLSFLNKQKTTLNKLDEVMDKIELIDIRELNEYKQEKIANSKNIPMQKILKNPDEYLDKNKLYYILCQSGMRSAFTVLELKKLGYNVINVSGGLNNYNGKNIV